MRDLGGPDGPQNGPHGPETEERTAWLVTPCFAS
jgi:hypothetical protein